MCAFHFNFNFYFHVHVHFYFHFHVHFDFYFRFHVQVLLDAISGEVCKPDRLSSASEQHLQNILYGLGNLVYRNTMMLDTLCEESRKPERLRRMTE